MMWQWTGLDYFLVIAGAWVLIAAGTVVILRWIKK